jgi:hypothetical protein
MEHQVNDITNFFLTLDSDGETHVTYGNQSNNFMIHFEIPIMLEGKWEVGLAEIFYKMTIPYLHPFEWFAQGTDLKSSTIKSFNLLDFNDNVKYDDQTLIKTFRMFMNGRKCEVLERNKYLFLKLEKDYIQDVEVELYPRLMDMLGLNHLNFKDNNGEIQGHRKVDGTRGLPSTIKVMTDIIHHQTVNNGSDKVLRNVPIDVSKYRYGCGSSYTFDRIHYFTVAKHKIDAIHVYIRDENGNSISFGNHPLKVILHFRKVKA